MRIFIAGVMQGNKKMHGIRSQNYRCQIAQHLQKILPEVKVIDPDKTDPERLSYDDKQAAEMFFRYCEIAGKVDLLIAYLPEASMGSAIEMWVAHKAGVPVVTISPLTHNWVVRLLSKRNYLSLELFKKKFSFDTVKELNSL